MQHMLRVKFDFRLLLIYRTTDPEVGSSNHHEYQQQRKGKGKSEITGGGLEKREVRGLGITKDRREMSEQEGRGGW